MKCPARAVYHGVARQCILESNHFGMHAGFSSASKVAWSDAECEDWYGDDVDYIAPKENLALAINKGLTELVSEGMVCSDGHHMGRVTCELCREVIAEALAPKLSRFIEVESKK